MRLAEERGREVSAQVGRKPQGGRPESGVSLASRKIGVTRQEAQRAEKIDSLAPEAKEAAVAAGLDKGTLTQKQADDDTLRKLADRIQARAVRRCGELLKQYDGRGRPALENKAGADPVFSQRQIGADAGMSERQIKTAVRVAYPTRARSASMTARCIW